jgi:hypothetical protein
MQRYSANHPFQIPLKGVEKWLKRHGRMGEKIAKKQYGRR